VNALKSYVLRCARDKSGALSATHSTPMALCAIIPENHKRGALGSSKTEEEDS
jgi:hypothetical protein